MSLLGTQYIVIKVICGHLGKRKEIINCTLHKAEAGNNDEIAKWILIYCGCPLMISIFYSSMFRRKNWLCAHWSVLILQNNYQESFRLDV